MLFLDVVVRARAKNRLPVQSWPFLWRNVCVSLMIVALGASPLYAQRTIVPKQGATPKAAAPTKKAAAPISLPPVSAPSPAIIGLVNQKQKLDAARQNADMKEKGALQSQQVALKKLQDKKAATSRWICNAYGVEHSDPSECTDPQLGGRWISTLSPADEKKLDDQLAKAKKSYDDAAMQQKAEKAKAGAPLAAEKKKLDEEVAKLSTPDFVSYRAQDLGGTNGAKSANVLAKDADLTAELAKAAAGSKYLTGDMLRTVVAVEAGANKNIKPNKFGYAGLFQLGPEALKDLKQTGKGDYTMEQVRDDWKTNVEAGEKFLELNAQRLRNNGVPVTAFTMYLTHQQGFGGAVSILNAVATNPDKPAGKNQLANLPQSVKDKIESNGNKVTVKDYYDYWSGYFSAVDAAVNAPKGNTPLP